MTPQKWIEKVAEYEAAAAQTRGIFLGQTVRFAREGAQHLAAALEEIAQLREKIEEMEEQVEFAKLADLTLEDVRAAASGNGPRRLAEIERREKGDAQ